MNRRATATSYAALGLAQACTATCAFGSSMTANESELASHTGSLDSTDGRPVASRLWPLSSDREKLTTQVRRKHKWNVQDEPSVDQGWETGLLV